KQTAQHAVLAHQIFGRRNLALRFLLRRFGARAPFAANERPGHAGAGEAAQKPPTIVRQLRHLEPPPLCCTIQPTWCMLPSPAITVRREFPLLDAPFLRAFWHDNLIVHARASAVAYDEHPGPLSIKCAFGGAETYVVDGVRLTVDDATYLMLNHGRPYASFI